ncbi:MAG: TolC family protein, partial [Leptospiraceae bacterium]|nr:TolC family protein [Leptospiraceae bacterium]
MKKVWFVFSLLAITSFGALVSQETERLNLTLKEAVQKAVENSPEVRNNTYELAKSDSGYLKSQSKYSWRLVSGVDSQKSVLPFNRNNIFNGTKSTTDKIYAGIEKIFQTGTYFKVEASSTRFDSNAFEDPIRNAVSGVGFSSLALPPLYTGAITVTLSQDLLKNSFGVQDRNIDKILEKQSEIAKLDLSYKLSNIIVETLVAYWNYEVNESSTKTYIQLMNNTKNIRNLTIRKTRLGLAENFEINQWNALLSQTENQLEKVKLEREEAKRKLLRILNLPSDTELGEITDMKEDLPPGIDFEKDLEYAFENRNDWKSVLLRKEIADLGEQNAKDGALPSVKLTGIVSRKGQTTVSPQNNFTDRNYGVTAGSFVDPKYYEATANLKVTYPIADKGVRASLRDSKISQMQVKIQEDDLRREIMDDIRIKYDTVI